MNSLDNRIPGFETLVRKALQFKQQIDKTLGILQEEAEGIRVYYEPRAEFDRWKQTKEGEEWKRGKWQRQKQCCAECNCDIPLKGSHIDHVKPLSKYPELNLTLSNLRITCPDCNLRKSDRELDASACNF